MIADAAALESRSATDWATWRAALEPFAAATGLCVTVCDDDAAPVVGPTTTGKVSGLLVAAGRFDAGGSARDAQSALARAVLDSGEAQRTLVGGQLVLQAAPIRRDGRVVGAVLYGWVFETFPTSLGCQRIGRELGVDGVRLWGEARLESPIPVQRMAVFARLLQTMIDTTAWHEDALARLVELARIREVFLATVSHELRTPLSALSARIELMLRGSLDDPEAIRGSLSKMREQVRAEAKLVEDLIEAARTRTGQFPVTLMPGSLAPILESAVATVGPIAQARQIRLEADTRPATDVPLMADAQRLQQVFSNLLGNAVKFTPSGGSIAVRVRSDRTECEVLVIDTGRGIPESMLAGVFKPFSRQTQGNDSGLGLGLSIARHIVEAHGGSIEAQSAGEGRGTTMRVRLPIRAGRDGVAQGGRELTAAPRPPV